jgi:hypothetical protein
MVEAKPMLEPREISDFSGRRLGDHSEFPGLAISTAQGEKSFYAVNRAEITRRRLEPYAIGNGCLYGRRKARYSTSKP